MLPEDALDDCLNDIRAGRRTVVECAAQFPELEAELRAALRLSDLRALTLRPEAERQAEAAWRRALASRPRRSPGLRRWAIAGLITLLTLFGLSTSALAAASAAVPGDALYRVKRAAETVQLNLTPASDRAALLNALAGRRRAELTALLARSETDPSALASLMTDMSTTAAAAIAAIEQAPAAGQSAILQAIIQEIDAQRGALQDVQFEAPPETQAEIRSALSTAAYIQHQALDRLGTMDPAAQATLVPSLLPTPLATLAVDTPPTAAAVPPASVPPGQAKKTTPSPATSNLPEAPAPTRSVVIPAHTPPGQDPSTGHTPSAPNLPTQAQPNAGNGQCQGNNPNCVTPPQDAPTVTPVSVTPVPSEPASPTPCPTNPGGQPKCRP
jgi:hypothetical protein